MPDHFHVVRPVGGHAFEMASMKSVFTLLLASLLSMGHARAALIEVATPLGPASAVLDTSSGLEWLKLSGTRDVSISQAFAGMAPGGAFEGFRYSTQDEFSCGLLAPQTGFGCGNYGASKDVARVRAFLDMFDTGFAETSLYAVMSPERSRESGWNEGYAGVFGMRFFYYPGDAFPVEYDSQLVGVQVDRPQTHWLVRQTQEVHDVPEPPMTALLGVGMLLLLLSRVLRPRLAYPS